MISISIHTVICPRKSCRKIFSARILCIRLSNGKYQINQESRPTNGQAAAKGQRPRAETKRTTTGTKRPRAGTKQPIKGRNQGDQGEQGGEGAQRRTGERQGSTTLLSHVNSAGSKVSVKSVIPMKVLEQMNDVLLEKN